MLHVKNQPLIPNFNGNPLVRTAPLPVYSFGREDYDVWAHVCAPNGRRLFKLKLTAEMAKIERMKLELVFPTNANIIGAQATVHNAYAGSFNPAELTAAANSAGHIDAAAPKKRASRKAKK